MLHEIEAATGKTPQALLDAPLLDSLCQELVNAYDILASKRTVGFQANPIQLSEIRAYIDLYGKPSVSIDIFISLLGSMDTTYLELSNKHGS